MSDRKYPDIDFVETDTETIESNLIALYENMVQQVPGREHTFSGNSHRIDLDTGFRRQYHPRISGLRPIHVDPKHLRL